MTVYITQANFARGELAPRLASRFDVDLFKAGVKLAENWTFLKQGGVTKRPGFQFMGEVKDSDDTSRLIPFVFGTLATGPQAYVIEFGHQYARIFTTNGQVIDGGTPVEIATPYDQNEVFNIDYVQSADVLYLTHPEYQTRKLTRTSDTAWTISLHETEDGPYLDEPDGSHATLKINGTGNLIPDMTSNINPSGQVTAGNYTGGAGNEYWAADRNVNTQAELGSSASGFWAYDFPGVTTKVAVGYALQCREQLNYEGVMRWTFDGFDGADWVVLDNGYKESGWGVREKQYFPINNKDAYQSYRVSVLSRDGSNSGGTPPIGLVEVAIAEDPTTQALITCTASSTAGINDGNGFSADDVGRSIRLRGSDNLWRWFEIKAYTSPTVVSGVVHGCPIPVDNEPIARWRMGALGSDAGWPKHIAFFDERLALASTKKQPDGVWLSKTGDFADHGVSTPLLDDDALSLKMIGGEINTVQFLSEGYDLIVGTSGAIRTIGVNNTNEGFSADNAKQLRHSTYAAADIKPTQIGNVTIFADYYNHALRELTYSFELNGYVTPELTVVSDHLFKSGVVQLAFSQDPVPMVLSPVGNGILVSTTYDRDQKVVASGRWILGGEGVAVESACCIPGPDRNEVWAIVKRTINGATKRYVERAAAYFDGETDETENCQFLDSFVPYSGAAEGDFSVPHLAGSTVTILADGVVHKNLEVDGDGDVSLPDGMEATKVLIGIPYRSRLELLRVPDPGPDGSRWGRRVKVQEVYIDVLESLSLRVGTQTKMFDLFIRDQNDPVPGPMLLRTGIYKSKIESSWFNQIRDTIVIQSEDPLPATVLSATLAVEGEP